MSLLLEITIDDHDRPPRTYTEDVSSEDEVKDSVKVEDTK